MPDTLTTVQMAVLDKAYAFTKSGNAKIEQSWLRLAIAHDYVPAMPRLDEYLNTVGRVILIRPLYQQMMKTEAGAAAAKRIYKKARANYHPHTVTLLDPIVQFDSEETSEPP
jgi:leukotriene-A4 hydrolase